MVLVPCRLEYLSHFPYTMLDVQIRYLACYRQTSQNFDTLLESNILCPPRKSFLLLSKVPREQP
jgi:hypothetical protein